MIELIGTLGEVNTEDSGAAKIADFNAVQTSGCDDAFFLRMQSWCEETWGHETFNLLTGKKLKITIEVLD